MHNLFRKKTSNTYFKSSISTFVILLFVNLHSPLINTKKNLLFSALYQVPDQYGTIRAVAEGKGEQFLVGTSRNFILRGTFIDGFQVEVQVNHL